MTFCQNRELAEGNPWINEVLLYDKQGGQKNWFGNFRFSRKIASKKFDIVIHLHATNRMHIVSWLAGIPIRIGYSRKSAWALTHPYEDCKKEGRKHEAEYNFDLLERLGISCPPVSEMKTFFPLPEKSKRSLAQLLLHHKIPQKPFVIIHPSASCPSKRWPEERFAEVCEKLACCGDFFLIFVGSKQDRPVIQRILRQVPHPSADLSGKLTLSMLGCLLAESRFLISNDSGPVHIADAVGTPVVSVFGRNQPGLSPKRWGPIGKKSQFLWKDTGCKVCLAHNCQIAFLCLDVITAGDVMAALRDMRVLPVEAS